MSDLKSNRNRVVKTLINTSLQLKTFGHSILIMLEKQLTNKIISFYKTHPNVYLYKRFASGNEAGKPDITGIYKINNIGIRLEIEVKAPRRMTNKMAKKIAKLEESNQIELLFEETYQLASKRQQYWLRKFQSYGAITGVVLSLNQLELLLNYYTETFF